jgi:inner membrane protein
MLILGHVGITIAAALAGEAALNRDVSAAALSRPVESLRRTLVSLSRKVDLRILAVASLLPDIIDKPLGLLLFPEALGTGRAFSHTAWFPLALLAAGLSLRASRAGPALLMLAFGSGMHLILDSMWLTPAVLLWPFLGPLPRGQGPDEWFATLARDFVTNPQSYVPEILGAILLLALLVSVAGKASVVRFLRTGMLTG